MKEITLSSGWLFCTVERQIENTTQYGFCIFNPDDGINRKTGDFVPEFIGKDPFNFDGVILWLSSPDENRFLQEELAIAVLKSQGYAVIDPLTLKAKEDATTIL